MLIKFCNRRKGQKSSRFVLCPYLGMPQVGPAPFMPQIEVLQTTSYYTPMESKIHADQNSQQNQGSEIIQIRSMPIFGHAPTWPSPIICPKLKFFKWGHIIHQSKANFMVINIVNRTRGQKSTTFDSWPYFDPCLTHFQGCRKVFL